MAVRSRKGAQTPREDKDNSANPIRKEPSNSGDVYGMSIDEKIEAIDLEIRTIHHFFVAQGFTPLEIERGAKPFIDCATRASRRKLGFTLLKIAAFLLICYGLVSYGPVFNFALMIGRITMVKAVLPYWDWRYIYDSQCLVENPYFEGDKLYAEDCEICVGLETIPRESNVSHAYFMEQYMSRDLPVIITDAIGDWPATKKFDINFLKELFLETPSMKDYNGCVFRSNIRSVRSNNKLFLKKAAEGSLKNYYADWENCMNPVAKGLRPFYEKPYFLPPSTEMSKVNWIFISNNFKGQLFKAVHLEDPFRWFAQIKGQSKIRGVPKPPCNESCKGPEATLKEGEILFITDRIWYLDYLPDGEGENIAIAAGGNFD